jgi:hypothetical protein
LSPLKGALFSLVLLTAGFAAAQERAWLTDVLPTSRATLSRDAVDVPFGSGEKSTFEVRFGAVRVGNGSLAVVGLDNVRGRDAWHIAFNVQGGTFFYRVNDVYESWIDTRTLNSLLFNRQIEEGTRDRTQSYEIIPERGTYIERTKQKTTTRKTVEAPLDEGAFL